MADCERSGGWGWLLGDEGSAFWIGREGLRAALRAQEGLGRSRPPCCLSSSHFQVTELIRSSAWFFRSGFGAQGFAALAPLVSAAAENGEPAAGAILRQAGQELGAAVQAVARRLDFGCPIPVAPVGGAFEHFQALRRSFEAGPGPSRPFQSGLASFPTRHGCGDPGSPARCAAKIHRRLYKNG